MAPNLRDTLYIIEEDEEKMNTNSEQVEIFKVTLLAQLTVLAITWRE
jgi:hypothetical protein